MLVGGVSFTLRVPVGKLAVSLSLYFLILEDNSVPSLPSVSFPCVVASASPLQLAQSLQGRSLRSLGRNDHFGLLGSCWPAYGCLSLGQVLSPDLISTTSRETGWIWSYEVTQSWLLSQGLWTGPFLRGDCRCGMYHD